MPRRGFILIAVTALVALACIGGFIASIWTSGDLSDRIFGTALVATMFFALPLGGACGAARMAGWFGGSSR